MKVEIRVNGEEIAHLYDRDVAGENARFAMMGQALLRTLNRGDRVSVNLHRGALRGGSPTATYTSFLGLKIASNIQSQINEI